jgi:hypothetical protein
MDYIIVLGSRESGEQDRQDKNQKPNGLLVGEDLAVGFQSQLNH